MTRFRLTPLAEGDLEGIHDYIAENSPANADQFTDSLMAECKMIRDYPYIGRGRTELGSGVRGFPTGDYVIFYRKVGSDVEILRFLHARRNIESLF